MPTHVPKFKVEFFLYFKIMVHSDTNNYQVACQRYFEFAHKTDELVAINHPNQYFEQSMRLLNNTANNNANKTLSTANNMLSNIKIEHVKVEMTQ